MPAYLVAEIDVTDTAAYEPYKSAASAVIAAHKGRYVARGGRIVPLEGAPPKRIAIIQFDSVEAAERFHKSAEYQKAIPLRKKAAAASRLYIVEGQ